MECTTGNFPGPHGSARHGGAPLVLFALEPRAYSEAIGQTVAELRPDLEVQVVEPEDLPAEVGRLTPDVVLCSRPKPGHLAHAASWAEYRPYDDPDVVRVDGRDEVVPGLRLEDLIGLVDRLAAAHPSGRLVERAG